MINHDARPIILDALLTLIFKMGQGACQFLIFLYRQPILHLWLCATYRHSDYPECKTNNHWLSIHTHFQDGVGSVYLFVSIIKAANTSNKDNDVPKSIFCNPQWDIWMQPWIEKPETQDRRLELMGPVKSGKTYRFTVTCLGLASQEAAGLVFARVLDWSDPFLRSKPRPLAGYPDPLLTIVLVASKIYLPKGFILKYSKENTALSQVYLFSFPQLQKHSGAFQNTPRAWQSTLLQIPHVWEQMDTPDMMCYSFLNLQKVQLWVFNH